MVLQGHRFEVSWQTRKARLVRQRGIELNKAARLLDDPRARLEYQADRPYIGQYRATGSDPGGRLLTLAAEISYPGEAEALDDIGTIRIYTAWHATPNEQAAYWNEG